LSERIRAIVATEVDGKVSGQLQELAVGDLGTEGVLVEVAYSTVNYKDGLAVTGKGRICRRTPLVCGIDLAGTVLESSDPRWSVGDRVLVNGYGLSEDQPGGYAQKQRVKSEFLVPMPAAFTLKDAMTIGTAGYTDAERARHSRPRRATSGWSCARHRGSGRRGFHCHHAAGSPWL